MEANGYTVAQAAEKLSVSEKTIRRYLKKGKIQAEKIWRPGGKAWDYVITSLDVNGVDLATEATEDEHDEHEEPMGAMDLSMNAVGTMVQRVQEMETLVVRQEQELLALKEERDRAHGGLEATMRLLHEKEQELNRLQDEKLRLGGQLGATMERLRNTEHELKLLQAPPKLHRVWYMPWKLLPAARAA